MRLRPALASRSPRCCCSPCLRSRWLSLRRLGALRRRSRRPCPRRRHPPSTTRSRPLSPMNEAAGTPVGEFQRVRRPDSDPSAWASIFMYDYASVHAGCQQRRADQFRDQRQRQVPRFPSSHSARASGFQTANHLERRDHVRCGERRVGAPGQPGSWSRSPRSGARSSSVGTKEGFSLNKVMLGTAGWGMERAQINDATHPHPRGWGQVARVCRQGSYPLESRGLRATRYRKDRDSRPTTIRSRAVRLVTGDVADDGNTLLHLGVSGRYGTANRRKAEASGPAGDVSGAVSSSIRGNLPPTAPR